MSKGDRHAALTPDRLSALCYQLWMMQQAGVPLEQGVAELLEDASAPWSRELLAKLRGALEGGLPLSKALPRSGTFPAHMLHMISIGEAGGSLEQVLYDLSEYYRREAELRDAVRRAVTYPALMGLLIAVVFFLLISKVLPVFLEVFDQLGLSLSPAAAALLRLGSVGKYIAGIFSVLLALAAIAMLFLYRTEAGARFLAQRAARGKGGAAALAVDRSRFSSAMALLLGAGLTFDESMERAAELVEHSALAFRLTACRAKMADGVPFPQALRETGVFEGLQTGLLAAGFRAGAPAKAMQELSRRSAADADRRLSQMLERFEYGLVVALCAAVGLVLLSVMLPLLGALSSIGI